MVSYNINFLESLVRNISFSFPDISNSATEKIFLVLILAYLINRLFTFLGRIIDIEDMLGFYISFIEGIINFIIFCYLTNSTWSFLPGVYLIWSLGTLWCYITASLALFLCQIQNQTMELEFSIMKTKIGYLTLKIILKIITNNLLIIFKIILGVI